MDKQILKDQLKHQAKNLAWRAITTVIRSYLGDCDRTKTKYCKGGGICYNKNRVNQSLLKRSGSG